MITAIAWSTPHHRLRRSLSSRRSLLVSALSNYHQSLCKGSTATQLRPRGTLIADQRRACAARPKGKYSRGRMALAPIRTREFSLPRGAAGGQGHSQFNSINFYVTHRFFVTFFPEESNVFPSSLPLVNPLHSTQPSPRPAPAPSGHSAYRQSSAIATWAHLGCWDADRTPSATRQPVDPDTATR